MKKTFRVYLFLGVFLLALLSLPQKDVNKIRGFWARVWGFALLEGEQVLDSMVGVPAHVVFRSPHLWHSVVWVNKGSQDVPSELLEINSPVIDGKTVVGVIDYVGAKQSRVRLITDPKLSIAVRAVRGGAQKRRVGQHIDTLLDDFSYLNTQNIDPKLQETLWQSLHQMKHRIVDKETDLYLAKGEVQGAILTSAATGYLLKGVGFNANNPDAKSIARDLRTGQPVGDNKSPKVPILQLYDVLETTGLDGIFPEGLEVAVITQIDPLQEGDVAYSLQARPSSFQLDDLKEVLILPPVGFDPMDLPPFYRR